MHGGAGMLTRLAPGVEIWGGDYMGRIRGAIRRPQQPMVQRLYGKTA